MMKEKLTRKKTMVLLILVTESDICKKYHALYEKAENYGITHCYQWKTMLDVRLFFFKKKED